jgi:hypothetical protein
MTIANVSLTSNTRAQVTVTLEIPIGDNWNGSTDINQVVGQAKDSALGKLRDIIRGGARIIGEPVVTMIMVDARE